MVKIVLTLIFIFLISACSNTENKSIKNNSTIDTSTLAMFAPGKGNSSKDSATNISPEISGDPITIAEIDQLYSFDAIAIDTDGDRLRFNILNIPTWLSFHKPTGRLSGTPLSTDVGLYGNILISVSDGIDIVSLPPFSIAVNGIAPANLTLQISGSPSTTIDEASAYYFKPSISGEDLSNISASAQNLPAWLSINNSTGELHGAPTFDDAGLYSGITLTVTDGSNTSELGPFSIAVNNVNRTPLISGATLETNEDASYSLTVSAIDPDKDAIHLELTNAPQFGVIQIDNTNLLFITYIPNSDYHGLDAFELSVVDAYGASSLAEFTMNIISVNDVPIAQADNISVTEGVPQAINVLTNDRGLGDGDLANGTLMLGIESHPIEGSVEIMVDGSINYLTNSNPANSDSFTYRVTDPDGETAIASVSVTINPDCATNCTTTKLVSWDSNTELNIKGYYVYHGTTSGEYTDEVWVGNVTEYEMVVNAFGDHFFAVKAMNTVDVVSDFSNEFVLSF